MQVLGQLLPAQRVRDVVRLAGLLDPLGVDLGKRRHRRKRPAALRGSGSLSTPAGGITTRKSSAPARTDDSPSASSSKSASSRRKRGATETERFVASQRRSMAAFRGTDSYFTR